jgi:hypothetical protein
MRGLKLAPKCLTWLLVMLASLQTAQGTPLACYLGACRVVNETGSQVCCGVKKVESASRGDHLVNIAAPKAPCNCPISCWCRHPVQALLQVGELTPLATGDEPVASWSSVVDTNDLRSAFAAAPAIPKSSQQVCAVLCRFLA